MTRLVLLQLERTFVN